MHYIRFMRAPSLSRSGKRLVVDLVLTINTDLSDAYCEPDSPLQVTVCAEVSSARGLERHALAGPGALTWRRGMRVLKPTMEVPAVVQRHLSAGDGVVLCVSAARGWSARGVLTIARATRGQVMPAYFALGGEGDVDTAVRRLVLGDEDGVESGSGSGNGNGNGNGVVEFEEELGESMARHIWDGGVVAMSMMAEAMMAGTGSSCLARFAEVVGEARVNVLELGCGIGVLGVGLAAAGRRCSVLMTDLPDAERRARANIARAGRIRDGMDVAFESLDWQDGSEGRLGPRVVERRWHAVMMADCTYNVDTLPALVGTLETLHAHNRRVEPGASTTLFLASKNRHESEAAVFALLAAAGWETLSREEVELPVLGAPAQTLELCLLERS